jgi:DNA-binding XRE family transcriptional regulator
MTAAAYKSRRIALGHTQQTLADVLSIDRVTVNRRETGKLPITAEAALAILKLSKTRK